MSSLFFKNVIMKKQLVFFLVFVFTLIQSVFSFGQSNGSIDNMRSDTIDVLNYQMKIDLTKMSTQVLTASCKIDFESKMDGVEGISLDLLKLTVDSVQSGGVHLNYKYNDTLLRVDFSTSLNSGD